MPPSTPLSSDDAAHLLRRAAFGGTPAEITALVGVTRQSAVDQMLDFTPAPAVSRPFTTNAVWWQAHQAAHAWWLDRMVTTPTPLQEKLTLFWHSHFAVGVRKVENMGAVFDHVQMLRQGAKGSFQALCQQSSVSPAMLVYLDNESNVVGSPQENFGRELMELHTVGVGNFTEGDVEAMTRAWTGYNTARQHNFSVTDITYGFYAAAHDNGQKTLMGTTKNWSGPEAVDELCFGAGQAATAFHIARKMWRYFVRTDPSASTIQPLADAFAASNMDIATLVRAILLHDDFWSADARLALVKSPVEFLVEVLRTFDLRIDISGGGDTGRWLTSGDVYYLMGFTGQLLFEPPNVNGWGVGSSWLSTATMWARARALSSIRWRVHELNRFGHPDDAAGLRNMTPAAGVQRVFDQMGINEPSAATRSRLEAWFSTLKLNNSWAIHPNAVMVGGLSPEFQLK